MAQEGEIVLTEIQETEWDEEAVLDSPFEAKDFIKVLPWDEYGEEVAEYGSLREKMRERNDKWTDQMAAAADAVEAYDEAEGFSDDFSTHVSWDADLNKWTIDADAFEEARKFWEFAGFEVNTSPGVSVPTTL